MRAFLSSYQSDTDMQKCSQYMAISITDLITGATHRLHEATPQVRTVLVEVATTDPSIYILVIILRFCPVFSSGLNCCAVCMLYLKVCICLKCARIVLVGV